jgi:hypothetical protein
VDDASIGKGGKDCTFRSQFLLSDFKICYSDHLQIMMAKVDSFLDSLITYDKENIHPEVIKAIQPYLKDSEFDPEFVRTKSGAAAGKDF